MKHQKRIQSVLAYALIFTMLVSCFMGLTMLTGAEETSLASSGDTSDAVFDFEAKLYYVDGTLMISSPAYDGSGTVICGAEGSPVMEENAVTKITGLPLMDKWLSNTGKPQTTKTTLETMVKEASSDYDILAIQPEYFYVEYKKEVDGVKIDVLQTVRVVYTQVSDTEVITYDNNKKTGYRKTYAAETLGDGAIKAHISSAQTIITSGEFSVWDKSTYSEPTNQAPDGYYLVECADHFAWILQNTTVDIAKNYRLTTNIDLNGYTFSFNTARVLVGNLDGAGYTVKNFGSGMKGYSGNGYLLEKFSGKMENITIQGFGSSAANSKAGMINNLVDSTLSNVRFQGVMQGASILSGFGNYVSGTCVVENCVVSGQIRTGGNAGGAAGLLYEASGDVTVSNCANYATLRSSNGYGCGVAGIIKQATGHSVVVENTINYGDVYYGRGYENLNTGAAGIIGFHTGSNGSSSNIVMNGCINYGNIVGEKSNAGGLIGYVNSPNSNNYVNIITMNECFNYGKVTAGYEGYTSDNAAGGLIGSCQRIAYVYNCANYGDVEGLGTVTVAGGFAGKLAGRYSQHSQSQRTGIQLYNSAIHGNISAVYSAGAVAGHYDSGNLKDHTGMFIYNSVITADATASYAGHLFGYGYTYYSNNSLQIVVENTFLGGTLTSTGVTTSSDVTDETTGETTTVETTTYYAGALAGYLSTNKTYTVTVSDTTYINDNGLDNLFNVAGTLKVAADYETYTPATYDATVLTNGTFVTTLNTYAVANGYKKWMATGAPYYIEYYIPALSLDNGSSLSKVYDGIAPVVKYTINATDIVDHVDVEWYDISSGSEVLLEAAPVDAGSYRVKVLPKSAENITINPEDKNEADFTISKADVTIGITLPEGVTSTEGGLTATYNGEAFAFAGEVKFGATVVGTPTVTISGAGDTALEPGAYTVTFAYAGDTNYKETTATYTLTIGKIQVAYPENTWTVPQEGSMKFSGGVQEVVLESLSDLFLATYENNDASSITAEGEYTIATATVVLKDTAHYEFAGEVVTYSLKYRVDKGDVVLKLLDANGDEVNLETLYYDGQEHTYTVYAYNENGDQVQELDSITLLNAGDYPRSYEYAGNEYYNGASISYNFVVHPFQITVDHVALDKTYNGEAVVAAPTYDKAGTTWTEELKWEQLQEGTYVELAGAPANAGTYRLTITVVSANGNYGGTKVVDFTIGKATPTFTWIPGDYILNENTGKYEITYDGARHSVTFDTNFDGAVEVLYGDGASVPSSNAGEYTVTATLTGGENYEAITVNSIVLVVNKKIIDLPDNLNDLWDYAGGYVYNGTEQKVELKADFLAQNEGAVVLVQGLTGTYENNSSINAVASMTAKVTIQVADPANIAFKGTDETSITLTLDWSIAKATISTGDIRFDTSIPVYYTGFAREPILSNLPPEFDYTLNYDTSAFVDAGIYNVVATLVLTAQAQTNYNVQGSTQISGTYEILPADVEIVISGSDKVTYDASAYEFNYDVIDLMGNAFSKDFVSVSIEKQDASGAWVACTAQDVVNAGQYRFTYTLNSDNLVGDVAKKVLTIGKATYPSSAYNVSGSTTVVHDGEEHTITLNTGSGLDGVKIVAENITGSFTEPGVHTIVFKLTGSDNYEPIDNYEVTLTILRSTLDFDTDGDKKQETDVTVGFENGLAPNWELEVKDADTSDIILENVFDNPKLNVQALYEFIITDADGEEQEADGKTTITLVVPKKLRDSDTLTFVVVTKNSKGKVTVKDVSTDKTLKKNYEYDPETGIFTLTVSDLTEARIGYVAENPFPILMVALIGGGVLLVVIIVIVLLVIMKKKKGPKPPKAPKAEDGEGTEVTPELDTEAAAETPWWETPTEPAPYEDDIPDAEFIPEADLILDDEVEPEATVEPEFEVAPVADDIPVVPQAEPEAEAEPELVGDDALDVPQEEPEADVEPETEAEPESVGDDVLDVPQEEPEAEVEPETEAEPELVGDDALDVPQEEPETEVEPETEAEPELVRDDALDVPQEEPEIEVEPEPVGDDVLDVPQEEPEVEVEPEIVVAPVVDDVPAEEPEVEVEPEIVVAPVVDDVPAEADEEEADEEEAAEPATPEAKRYRRSFMSRMIQATPAMKGYYSAIKNALLAFKKVNARTSWKCETFKQGRKTLCRINLVGKNLCISLALSPEAYQGKRFIKDVSKRSADTPLLVKVKSEQSMNLALRLIAAMAEQCSLISQERAYEDFCLPYEDDEALLAKGLIKEVTPDGGDVDTSSEQPQEPIEE